MIAKRIRKLRKALHLTQHELGFRLGINASAISQMESNLIRPSLDTLIRLGDSCGVNLHWFITGRGSMFEDKAGKPTNTEIKLERIHSFINEELAALVRLKEDFAAQDYIELKVEGEIAAGLPAESSDSVMDVINLRRSQVNGVEEELLALRVNGHSMEPFICHDDLVVIRCSQDWNHLTGQICAVRIDGAITLKRLDLDPSRQMVILQPLNNEYKPIKVKPSEHQEVSLIGVMKYMYRKM